MARMPGALWRPLPASTTRITQYDILCWHTMVGSLWGTDGYFRSIAPGVNSHFGVGGDGEIIQWVDTAYRSSANLNGNWHIISVETADLDPEFARWNTNDGNAVPAWTEAQLKSCAEIAKWVHETHGIPLSLIPDAKVGRRGQGYHRQGVPGYMVEGAERWSNAVGKVCPGNRRIAQIPRLIQLAQGTAGPTGDEDMPLNDADKQWLRDNIGWSAYATMPYGPDKGKRINAGQQLRDVFLDVQHLYENFAPGVEGVHHNKPLFNSILARIPVIEGQVTGLSAAVAKLSEAVAAGRDDLTAEELKDAVSAAIQEAGAALKAVEDTAP